MNVGLTFRLAVTAGLILIMPAGALGQWTPPPARINGGEPLPVRISAPRDTVPAASRHSTRVPTAYLSAGGLAGAVVGTAAGAVVGIKTEMLLSGSDCSEWCGFGGLVLGSVLGEVLGLPLGVHLANRSRGSYVHGVLASAAAGVATSYLLTLRGQGDASMLLIPISQLVAVVSAERAAERARGRRLDQPKEPQALVE